MNRPRQATQLLSRRSAIRRLDVPREDFFHLCRDAGLQEFRWGRARLFRVKDINRLDRLRFLTREARDKGLRELAERPDGPGE